MSIFPKGLTSGEVRGTVQGSLGNFWGSRGSFWGTSGKAPKIHSERSCGEVAGELLGKKTGQVQGLPKSSEQSDLLASMPQLSA